MPTTKMKAVGVRNYHSWYSDNYTTSLGYSVHSRYELYAHEYLIAKGVEFEFEVRLPWAPRRRADLRIKGLYIEIDGVRRSKFYWDQKYRGHGNKAYIIPVYSFGHQWRKMMATALDKFI